MHIYCYSFLEKLALPENLAALLASLHRLNHGLNRRLARDPQALSDLDALPQSQQAIRQLEEDSSLEYAPVPVPAPGVPTDAQDFLNICQSLLPDGPPPDEEKSQAVSLALSAYQDGQALGIDPLLLVPCAVLDLICLSPLPRYSHTAALLASRLLLCGSGYLICRYVSLEQMICRYHPFYQRELFRAKAHWEENGSDYLPYLEIFLSMLYLCYRQLPAQPQRGGKRAAVEALVLSSQTPISKAEICAALPGVSQTTI